MKKNIFLCLFIVGSLNSCVVAAMIEDTVKEYKDMYKESKKEKKDAPKAHSGGLGRYEPVLEAIKDVSSRPVNNKIIFAEKSILIPENTRINEKYGNLVDNKTGLGIDITIHNYENKECEKNEYTEHKYFKKDLKGYLIVERDLYGFRGYNLEKAEITEKESKEFIEKIFQNIVKENGITKGCPN